MRCGKMDRISRSNIRRDFNLTDSNPLSDYPFAFQATKNGKVFITWYDRQAKILTGKAAEKFLKDVESLDEDEAQLLMARVTGNFKRGNERVASDHNR